MADVILDLPKEEVLIDYTNWRGERRWRRIRPLRVAFENSEWHHDTQWILHAVDVEMAAMREFAMKDIHAWNPVKSGHQ
jgi:predicted DNA-binding transcriptional regulator YafY